MRINQIDQFNTIGGVDRGPGIGEDDKVLKWDNGSGEFIYETITPGDVNVQSDWDETSSGEDSFILNKPTIPTQLSELSGDSDDIAEGGINLFLTDGERTKLIEIAEGAEVNVQSDWNAISGDALILNKPTIPDSLDDLSGTLDDITAGTTNKHFTSTYKTNVDLNILARHSHTNKDSVLDNITDFGSGEIITVAERQAITDMVSGNPEVIRDTVAAFIQDTSVVTWTHDDEGDTLTPEIVLDSFTTDDLTEGDANLYGNNTTLKTVFPITLPAYASVAIRCSNAVEGTNYPTGWVLTAGTSEYDLSITHSLGRQLVDVTVFEILSDTTQRVLPAFSSAYTGFKMIDSNEILIEGLTQKEAEIRINIVFAWA